MINFAFDMENVHEKLLNAIEHEVGKKMLTPKDFEWLSAKVEARVKEHLSESTLMRLWGYRKGVMTRQSTLDILSRFLGYADYGAFSKWSSEDADKLESDEVVSHHLYTEELKAGERLLLTWYQGRRCLIQLRDDGFFVVLEAENTKLSAGDTFKCSIFVEGEPLYMSQLVHEGQPPVAYMAGKQRGISFTRLDQREDDSLSACSE